MVLKQLEFIKFLSQKEKPVFGRNYLKNLFKPKCKIFIYSFIIYLKLKEKYKILVC